MKARLLPPKGNYNGNLVWCKEDFTEKSGDISVSLEKLRSLGYWASAFPEGDGVTFHYEKNNQEKNNDDILEDIKKCFQWLTVDLAKSTSSDSELAELVNENKMLECIIIVPIDKIYIQETISIGKYSLFCGIEFDEEPHERLSDENGSYIQFNFQISYKNLLKINESVEHNNYVINMCLSVAEYALDLVRYSHGSFLRKESTPNPAGQRSDGFFEVEIIPPGGTHLKPVKISGISRPVSVSNNWLGPQVDSLCYPGLQYLSDIFDQNIENELSKLVIGVIRLCRQSFYSIGDESVFLNLIFALDGISNVESNWKGWKQRTYIAALTSNSSPSMFKKNLEDYDKLYTEVRNKLVHEGKDFYQLHVNADESSEKIFIYIKKIVALIESSGFSTIDELKNHAIQILTQEDFKIASREVIDSVSLLRGVDPKYPSW